MPVKNHYRYRSFAHWYYKIGSPTYMNVMQSAIKAGYSYGYASKNQKRLLVTQGIQKALETKRKQIEDALPDDVADIGEIVKVLSMGLRFHPKNLVDEDGKARPLSEINDETAFMLKGMKIDEKVLLTDNEETAVLERKIKYEYPDKRQYAESLAKIFGLINGNKSSVDDLLERIGVLIVQNTQVNNIVNQTNPSKKLLDVTTGKDSE